MSYSGGTAIVEYRRGELTGDGLEAIVRSCGYGIAGEDEFLAIQTRGGRRWVQAFIDHVDETKCNGCGACVRSCGQGVYALIELGGRKVATVLNGDNCLGDCHCHKACKVGALVCRPRRL